MTLCGVNHCSHYCTCYLSTSCSWLAKRSSHYQKGTTSKNIHESGGSFSFTFSFKLDHTPPIKYIVATKRKVTCNTYSVLPEYILKTFLFASHVFKRQTHTVWGNFIDAKSSLWFFIQPNQEVFFPFGYKL